MGYKFGCRHEIIFGLNGLHVKWCDLDNTAVFPAMLLDTCSASLCCLFPHKYSELDGIS